MSTPTTKQGAQPTHSHPPPIRENIQMHSGQIPTAATPDTVGNRDGQGIMSETCPFRLRIIRPGDANSRAPHIVVIIHINAHRAAYVPSDDSSDDL